MKFREFPRFDEASAPPAAQAALAESKRAFGAIPEPLTRYAGSPPLLSAALAGLSTFERASLSALEREVVAMTMGHRNGCRLCLDLHRRLLRAQQAPADVISALEDGTPLPERRLEALRQFVIAAARDHGDVGRETWNEFRDAGFDHGHALDVVLGIGVYTLTTLANRLTETSE